MGHIYFVRSQSYVKIGFTARPISVRLRELQSASPHAMELLGSVKGDRLAEEALHRLLHHAHVRGEWYEDGPWIGNTLQTLKNDSRKIRENCALQKER
jgi:hypothetical protein